MISTPALTKNKRGEGRSGVFSGWGGVWESRGRKNQDTMRWLVLTPSDGSRASTEYRIKQMQSPMAQLGCHLEIRPVNDFGDPKGEGFTGVVVQKILPGKVLLRQIVSLRMPTVFDLDDAVWVGSRPRNWLYRLKKRARLRRVVKVSNIVMAANRTLGSYLRENNKVRIIPMALDPVRWIPKENWGDEVVFGWAGAPENLGMLERLNHALCQLLEGHPRVKLHVFSGARPRLSCPYQYTAYGEADLPQVIRSFSVGLVPLYNNTFSSGKSPIKALQYMACGIPFVGTPGEGLVEMSGEVGCARFAETEDQWLLAMRSLTASHDRLRGMGRRGRGRFETEFTVEVVADKMNRALREAVIRRSRAVR